MRVVHFQHRREGHTAPFRLLARRIRLRESAMTGLLFPEPIGSTSQRNRENPRPRVFGWLWVYFPYSKGFWGGLTISIHTHLVQGCDSLGPLIALVVKNSQIP